MRVALEIPDEAYVVSLTLVAPRLPDGSVHTFVHCFSAKEGKTIRVVPKEGEIGYRAEEVEA